MSKKISRYSTELELVMKTDSHDLYVPFRLSRNTTGFTNWLKEQTHAEAVTPIGFIHPDEYRYRIGYLFKWSSQAQMTLGLISTEIEFYEDIIAIVDENV